MFMFVAPETPEAIQHQEDWINSTLRADYPTAHVCLHADRTTTVFRPEGGDQFAVSYVRVECDYCPAVSVHRADMTVELTPWYF